MKLLITENSYIAEKVNELLDSGKLCNGLFNKGNCIISFCDDAEIKNILIRNTITELYIVEKYTENYCCVLNRKYNNMNEIPSLDIKLLKECFNKIHTDELKKLIYDLPNVAFSNKIITKRDNFKNKISLGKVWIQ